MRDSVAIALAVLLAAAGAVALFSTRPSPAPEEEGGGAPRTEVSAPAEPPRVLPVPAFSLIDQDGKALGLAEFRGRAFVIDFIYTKCNGPCPMMSAQLRDLHRKFEGEEGVRFLTVSVDPRNDTPEVLRDYAEIYEAIPGLWIFATGPEEEILRLERDGLKLNTGAEAVEHSTHFVLVDGEGWVRGYYDGREDARVAALEADLRGLLRKTRP